MRKFICKDYKKGININCNSKCNNCIQYSECKKVYEKIRIKRYNETPNEICKHCINLTVCDIYYKNIICDFNFIPESDTTCIKKCNGCQCSKVCLSRAILEKTVEYECIKDYVFKYRNNAIIYKKGDIVEFIKIEYITENAADIETCIYDPHKLLVISYDFFGEEFNKIFKEINPNCYTL